MTAEQNFQYALAHKRQSDGQEVLHSGWFLTADEAVQNRVEGYGSEHKIYLVRRPMGPWEHYEFGDQLIAYAYVARAAAQKKLTEGQKP